METDLAKEKEFWSAYAKLKAAMPTIVKDAKNPHFKNTYASLNAIHEVIDPIIAEHGFTWLTMASTLNGEPSLKYVLKYLSSGCNISDEMLLNSKGIGPQDQGSAITYARRYSITAVLGLQTDDDDGQKAQEQAKVVSGGSLPKQHTMIFTMLAKLEKTLEEYETALGKKVEKLTYKEAGQVIETLQSAIAKRSLQGE